MKPLISLFLALLVVGCSCKPVYIDREVKVAVPVPCRVAPIDKPVMPLQEAKTSEEFGVKLKKALAEIELRKGYETKLEAGVRSCQ